MLTFLGSCRGTNCAGATRREFLQIGALGMSMFALPDLLRARGEAKASGKATKNTSVIWYWMNGGATHIETFDPKMSAPAEYRSVVGAVQTKLPGLEFGSLFPKLAQLADKMAIVRSFSHDDAGHPGGTHWVMTGYANPGINNGGPPIRPSFGSILSRVRGPNNTQTGLPNYFRLNNHVTGDGPVWLGSAYGPCDLKGEARNNMDLRLPTDKIADRRTLLKRFDNIKRHLDQSGVMEGMDSFETQAFDLILGQARKAFDLGQEDPRTRDRYGADHPGSPGLGKNLLLARRLCEAGVGFVLVDSEGWDMHSDVASGMKRLAPEVDRAVSALVEDLSARGLDREILLVISGDFGRTPRLNKNAGGRDHWPQLCTLALAGGGLKMGQVIGQSSPKAEVPKSSPITPQDLMATVFHVLGLPLNLEFQDLSGRPRPMINGGKPIAELV